MNTPINGFLELPPEITLQVMTHFDHSSVLLVCRQWHTLLTDTRWTLSTLRNKKITLAIEKELDRAHRPDRETDFKCLNALRYMWETCFPLPSIKDDLAILRDLKKLLSIRLSPWLIKQDIQNLSTLKPSYPLFLQLLNAEQDHHLLSLFQQIGDLNKSPVLNHLLKEQKQLPKAQQAAKLRLALIEQTELKKELSAIETISSTFNKQLTLFPKELALLTHVKRVYLPHNSLKTIPENFGETWSQLEELYLNNNKIEEIPEGFGQNWKRLKILSLTANDIESLPDVFGAEWSELETLYLSLNKIKKISEGFGSAWIKLKKIELSFNSFKELSSGFGKSWEKLEWLVMSQLRENKITLSPELKNQWPLLQPKFCKT